MEFNFWHGMNNDFLLLANYNTPKEANQIIRQHPICLWNPNTGLRSY